MAEFKDRLEEALSLRDMKPSELAKQTGIGEGAISQYRKGAYKATQRNLEKIAEALRVPIPWLMGIVDTMASGTEKQLPPNILPFPSTSKRPRVGRIACGTPILAEENIEIYDEVPDYIKCDFTLMCKGDSMIGARIFDGDIVCIRAQETIESGEIAAVMVGEDEATLKRVELFDDHIVLQAENPMYKPMVFWEEDMNKVSIIGKATHFISVIK